jgi:hypothetical protein
LSGSSPPPFLLPTSPSKSSRDLPPFLPDLPSMTTIRKRRRRGGLGAFLGIARALARSGFAALAMHLVTLALFALALVGCLFLDGRLYFRAGGLAASAVGAAAGLAAARLPLPRVAEEAAVAAPRPPRAVRAVERRQPCRCRSQEPRCQPQASPAQDRPTWAGHWSTWAEALAPLAKTAAWRTSAERRLHDAYRWPAIVEGHGRHGANVDEPRALGGGAARGRTNPG